MQFRIILICSLLAFLAACAPATATPSATPTGTTIPSITFTPTAPPTGTVTVSPTQEIILPTEEIATPTETPSTPEPTLPPIPTLIVPPTPGATSLPQPEVGSSAIQFYGPGPVSKLRSPIIVNGYAIPGYGNRGRVSLYGEDGRLLDSKLLQLNTVYTWAYFYGTLKFETQGVGELGRLTMSTTDEFGRLSAVNSVHVFLLPEGFSIINPPGNLKERCVIDLPAPGRRISGGTMTVTGKLRPYNTLPMVVELITRNGKVIGSQAFAVTPAPDDSYVPFSIVLPYTTSVGTWARLNVSEQDDRIAGMMYLYSREIYLNP